MHTTNKIIKPNNPNFANYTNKKLKKIKKDFLKDNVYDNITYLLQPKRKKIKSDLFKIPKMSEFNLLLTNDYNVSQLKKICKHYKLKVGGLKKVLIFRVYNYLKYSYYSIKIQKIVKGNIIRKINKKKGPALFNKKLCVNEVDFLTLEPIKNTTYADFFSFKDTDDFIYGFDICSLWNLYIVQDKNARKTKMKSRVMNPYNRKHFPSKLIRRLKRVIKMQKSINYPANIKLEDDTQELSDEKKIELECIRLFQKIDEKGHVTNINWFMDLTPQKILKFIYELKEIWEYRAQINNTTRNNIYPPRHLFNNVSINILRFKSHTVIRQAAIKLIGKLIESGTNDDFKSLGMYYVLGALTMVNNNAATSYPWLYESFYLPVQQQQLQNNQMLPPPPIPPLNPQNNN